MSDPKPAAYDEELRTALAAVREAGLLCRAVQAELNPGVLQKQDRSPVTVADFGSQALICRALAESFPADPVIGEEDAAALRDPANAVVNAQVTNRVQTLRPGAEPGDIRAWIDRGSSRDFTARFWTLDPIDGTKGFLRGEQYAIALALIVDSRLELAALGCPNLGATLDEAPHGPGAGTVLTAVRGHGAWAWPLTGDGDPVPVRVSELTDPAGLRFCESVEAAHSSHDDAARIAVLLGVAAPGVRVDSQVKYGVTARGEADAYLRLPKSAAYAEKIWDHAAGALVVLEAGGRVSDIHGRDLDFSRGHELSGNRGVIVSNGRLHDAVLGAIRELGIGE
ncbi:3'(2'),5'-bisphosphate nucleotidase [bacterium]|nr:3'(2'),5'-bisphosphate nucleotidase [bacterium]MBU1073782.1 3'(2'),5'-bisphosphate nucleotidase [bacterium]MBU1676642.1 3'(2'),5'-bisphosphate nucleotidase [bacterium]